MLNSLKKVKNSLFLFLTVSLTLIPSVAQGTPVQCYIGQNGEYLVCDIQEIGDGEYLLIWPDGEATALIIHGSPSGSYAEIVHVDSGGTPYSHSTRYPHTHYQPGEEWMCLHRLPGGRGGIDFCLTKF